MKCPSCGKTRCPGIVMVRDCPEFTSTVARPPQAGTVALPVSAQLEASDVTVAVGLPEGNATLLPSRNSPVTDSPSRQEGESRPVTAKTLRNQRWEAKHPDKVRAQAAERQKRHRAKGGGQ